MRYFAWFALFATLLLAGCSNARLVNSSPTGGCVAIENNSDVWPTYNRTRAIDLIKQQAPAGYTILKEEEVVVGQTTTNNSEQDTKEVPIMKGVAVDVKQRTRNTTTVRDQTEWRIWYQKAPPEMLVPLKRN